MDVILGKPRRRWDAEEKRAIVAETFLPGNSVNGVARRHQISPGMLFNWRKRFRNDPRWSAGPLEPSSSYAPTSQILFGREATASAGPGQ